MRRNFLQINKIGLFVFLFVFSFNFTNLTYAQDSVGGKNANSDVGGVSSVNTPSNFSKTTINPEYQNINSSSFRLVICDGPVLPDNHPDKTPNYVPCDFKGLMMQLQHIINIAMVAGIILAIIGLTYAGFLYITGIPKNITQAHDIFPALIKGFILMLSAWFIVYQILEWLTGSRGFGVLLGS